MTAAFEGSSWIHAMIVAEEAGAAEVVNHLEVAVLGPEYYRD